MVWLTPELESEAIPPPPRLVAGQPRIRCVFFVEHIRDPTTAEHARVQFWRMTELQQICSRLEKDYSRAIAKQAVPLFMSEVNGLKTPHDVWCKFHLMVDFPDKVQPLLDVSSVGTSGDEFEGGELFQQRMEELLDEIDEGSSESGS